METRAELEASVRQFNRTYRAKGPRVASRWYYRYPGAFYANGPTTGTYTSAAAVRRACDLKRNVEVWRAN